MITVKEINDLRTLALLRTQWQSLLSETPGASFFQSYDWLETYWNHFGAGQRLRVLTVWNAEKLVGIVPLVVRQQQRQLHSLSVLTYPLDDWGSFYGPIGSRTVTILQAALTYVRTTPRDWDLIELPWVDARGSDQGHTAAALAGALLPAIVETQQASALIELANFPDWQAYWASRTSRWRNNVRRSQRKLAENGQVTHLRYRPLGSVAADDDPRWDLYLQCERIAQASWQGQSHSGTTLSHAAIRPFLRDCHAAAVRTGALDLNLLYVDGVAVAFNYAYHYRGHVFGLRTGYDASHATDGAGTVLQARMIEDTFARGDHTYNLGAGYLECKRYWQSEVRYGHRYTHFPWAPLAQMVRAKRQIERFWKELAPAQPVKNA
jgi:CelD/BcsL family acetyltransferase involved in cellulose biosynthesis